MHTNVNHILYQHCANAANCNSASIAFYNPSPTYLSKIVSSSPLQPLLKSHSKQHCSYFRYRYTFLQAQPPPVHNYTPAHATTPALYNYTPAHATTPALYNYTPAHATTPALYNYTPAHATTPALYNYTPAHATTPALYSITLSAHTSSSPVHASASVHTPDITNTTAPVHILSCTHWQASWHHLSDLQGEARQTKDAPSLSDVHTHHPNKVCT